MPKYLKVFLLVIASVFALSGTANALSVNWFDVVLEANGISKNYRTTAETVGDFLAEQGIVVGEFDSVTPAEYAALILNKPTRIIVKPGFKIALAIDGKIEFLPVIAGTTVGELIDELQFERGATYAFAGDRTSVLLPDKEIKLSSTYSENSQTLMPLVYETEIVHDSELEIGIEEIIQQGIPGELRIISELTYLSGELAKTQVLSEEVLKEPVPEIVRLGTKEPKPEVETESGPKNYSRVIEMSATAYSAHYECTGKNPGDPAYGITASGRPVDHGVVAVDPSVIPLGTRLYVEGYGESIAADTGSAIVGNKIDLYHEKLEDAKRYGRRSIKVYVLE